MKLLSVTVPCYNSQAYMRNCVDSLLEGGDLVEILIVDDGSQDGTAEIADDYAQRYPTIIKAIHQENGGHGEAVNAGIRNATGLYFKVVDSDDWVNEEAYRKILRTLEELTRGPQTVDLLISNFVYEKQGAKRKKIMRYTKYMPEGEIFTWKEMGRMPLGKYILMHSVIYRTGLLRECGLVLPKHTFYVDNLFVYQPLPSVRTMYYMDVNFYRYFIGREDQSVHEDSGTEENLEKKNELWKYLKSADIHIYRKLRMGILGRGVNLPGGSGRNISVAIYKLAQKFYGFN